MGLRHPRLGERRRLRRDPHSRRAGDLHLSATSVAVLGTRALSGGLADVHLDGVLQSSAVAFFAPSTRWQVAVWRRSVLSDGVHTVEVTVLGSRQAAPAGTDVDSLQVT